jgi:Lon-like ATP-dependent protease
MLVPDTQPYLQQPDRPASSDAHIFSQLQARLCYGLTQLLHPSAPANIMLVKSPELPEYPARIGAAAREMIPGDLPLCGGRYQTDTDNVSLMPPVSPDDDFTAAGAVVTGDWIESEQLFGCVRWHGNRPQLQPGLLHQANGGVLVLSLRSLLAQPLLWLRLKQMMTRGQFEWFSPDERRPFPVEIPPLPLQVKLILCGERDALAEFQEMEPEIAELAIYSEFEDNLQIVEPQAFVLWRDWVQALAAQHQLPQPQTDAWIPLVREGVRYTGDQLTLPIEPEWILRQLREMAPLCQESFSGEQFHQMLAQREWREGFLSERMQDEILLEQILIETEGVRTGQVNALSVIEFPGHPRAFGEPSRITCVAHIGDGEFTDIERKAELGGNIHAKGMMIMQAFLMAELDLEQQIPFSASLTFEQSYSEVDGDSASMAELCALVSALSGVPLRQGIAITGSVDQFGRSQPVGGLNEKIEGFFTICQQRELTGQQGVIIPMANVRHLALHQEVLDAVEAGQFSIWAVDDARDALMLLSGLPWDDEQRPGLLQMIQGRIAQATQQEARHRYPWPLRWLNWFNHN